MIRKFMFSISAATALLVPSFALAASPGVALPNIGLLRHLDATDFLWYADPTTNTRYFVGTDDQAVALVEKFAQEISPLELVNWSPRVSPGIVAEDTDGDGLPDTFEKIIGSDPHDVDSDGDSYRDGLEIQFGYSPIAGSSTKIASNPSLRNQWQGAILRNGADFWYINPKDNNRYFLGGLKNIMTALFALTKPLNSELGNIPVAKDTAMWLNLPTGYKAEIYASGLLYPRMLALDPQNHLVASELLDKGQVIGWLNGEKKVIISNLFMPHGVAFANGRIYVAREEAIEYWPYDATEMRITGPATLIHSMKFGGTSFPNQGHPTRTIKIGSDNMLYLSIGSNCDSCLGYDKDRALVKRMDLDGKNVEIVSRGLRNTVFFAEHPVTHEWWGNDMGQDGLGDEYPPDELNRLVVGKHYGWPYCVANKIPAPINPKPAECLNTTPPEFNYGAHVAPLGLAFIDQTFSAEHENDILVAFHGSVIPTGRVGYNIQRVQMDPSGRPQSMSPFITGFLRRHGIVGRPVDILSTQSGELYISDDFARLIYRVTKK